MQSGSGSASRSRFNRMCVNGYSTLAVVVLAVGITLASGAGTAFAASTQNCSDVTGGCTLVSVTIIYNGDGSSSVIGSVGARGYSPGTAIWANANIYQGDWTNRVWSVNPEQCTTDGQGDCDIPFNIPNCDPGATYLIEGWTWYPGDSNQPGAAVDTNGTVYTVPS